MDDLLDEFEVWAAARGEPEVDREPIADLIGLRAELIDTSASGDGPPKPRYWRAVHARLALVMGSVVLAPDEAWLRSARRGLPLFFDFLAATGDPGKQAAETRKVVVEKLATMPLCRTPLIAAIHYRIGMAAVRLGMKAAEVAELPWPEQEKLAGPLFYPLDLSALADGPPMLLAPTPVPSVTARLARESALLRQLVGLAEAAVRKGERPAGADDWLWSQVVFQAFVVVLHDRSDPRILHPALVAGGSLRRWQSHPAEVWIRAMGAVVNRSALGPGGVEQPEVAQTVARLLFEANRSGEALLGAESSEVLAALKRLKALGAIGIRQDKVRLTRLGAVGFGRIFPWPNEVGEALEIPAWSPNLTAEDVALVLNASAEGTVGATFTHDWPQAWIDAAEPHVLVDRLTAALPALGPLATERGQAMLAALGAGDFPGDDSRTKTRT